MPSKQKYKKRKDGLYSTRVTIGYDSKGDPIIKTVYGKTQKELTNRISEAKESVLKSGKTFSQIYDMWEIDHEKSVGFNTMKGYKEAYKKLENIQNKMIEEISAADIQNIINDLHAKGFSKSTIKRAKLVYSLIANYAIATGFKIFNYSKQIYIPKNAKENRREDLSDEQIEIIKKSVFLPFGNYAYIMLYTGLRRGELCALQWKDIDTKNKLIHITKAITFVQNQAVIKPPKTKRGFRDVPLLNTIAPFLKPEGKDPEEYIFGGKTPMSDTMVKRRWSKYIKASGLENVTQHQLRHTYATILYMSGVDVKTAQSILGHADVETTLQRYNHAEEKTKLKKLAEKKLNKYVNSKKAKAK